MNTLNEFPETNEEVEEIEFSHYEELMESRKISIEDIRNHLSGPVISTMVHIVLLAFLGTIIVFKTPETKDDLIVHARTLEFSEIEPPPIIEEPPEPLMQERVDMTIGRPEIKTEIVINFETLSLDTADEVPLPNSMPIALTNSALTMPVNSSSPSNGPVGCDFLNARSSGQRFLFILDYSASMNKDQLLVLKSHLMKTLANMKGKGEVALLFFAGPAWLPEDNGAETKTRWGSCSKYDHFDQKNMSSFYPKVRWMTPNKHNLAILDKYICKTALVGGTNWSHPFRIALENMTIKPDVIFFMTDGSVNSSISGQCIELVKKYGKNITINTIGFGVTSGDLQEMATLSKGGKFIGYSKGELKSMAKGLTLPTNYTDKTQFDYHVSSPVKMAKEEPVKGLKIEDY